MAYIALYREWRPTLFEDVVEQEHVVKTLRYSVSNGRVAHAYLFCGTRGTGKTTMAHILSRAINCLNPNNGDPCNQCEVCREILAGSCVDVLEMDAASNNSVDNVRSIREEVIYAPTKAKRKIYIIDEVHMLSTGAFNALLKTLEEPPEHVIFILATTEPHKLPATILSRCQRFDFRRISHDSIVKRLDKIAVAGGKALDPDAARLMARLSDGAMRDAISLLDQCISLGSDKISYDDVLSVVGIVKDTFMSDFIGSMLNKEIPSMLENVGRIVSDGRDIAHFVSDLVLYFRNLLICKVTNGKCDDLVDVPLSALEVMKEQTGSISQDEIIAYVKELSALETSFKWASNPRVLLEVTLIKLCGTGSSANNYLPSNNSGPSVRSTAPASARAAHASPPPPSSPPPSASSPSPSSPSSPSPSPSPSSVSVSVSVSAPAAPASAPALPKAAEFQQWPKIMSHLKDMGRMALYSFLLNAKAVCMNENTIGLVFNDTFAKTHASRPEHKELIEEAIMKIAGRKMTVKCMDEESFCKSSTKPKLSENDEWVEKARSVAEIVGLPLEIIDE